MNLSDRSCVPCRGGVPPLAPEQAESLLGRLNAGWQIADTGHLEREFQFDDFAAAMRFADRVGEIAEAEGHHPDLHIAWGRCGVEIWTHKIDGLTESDFVLAAKIDRAAGVAPA